MDGPKDQEHSKLMLMISPTTGKLLLVLPSNTIGFSGIASVDAFSDQLSKQLAAVKRLLHGDDDSPISSEYGPQAVLEWEDTLKNMGTDNDDRPDN
ncbi:hypothetical protein M1N45_03535 [Dehalococcoidia bacterium]|nr:hypothetical protein [Dehalococcoidia bacterium]